MGKIREIRSEEIVLVKHLLRLAEENPEDFVISQKVDEYENGVMGSINFTLSDQSDYDSDFVRVEYVDEDQFGVLISLTKNKAGELLDLDFWKVNFSKLLRYPKPEDVKVNTSGMI